MVKVASAFRALADGKIGAGEAQARLAEAQPEAVFSNGFFYAVPGAQRVGVLA
jgi:hypothetical protein